MRDLLAGRGPLTLPILLAALLPTGPVRSAHAEAPQARAPQARCLLEVVVIGNTEDLAWVRRTIGGSTLARFEVRWKRQQNLGERDLRMADSDFSVRCFVDLRHPNKAQIYFANAHSDRFLLRDVPLSGTFGEMDREALAQVIDLSLRALAEDPSLGTSRSRAMESLRAAERPAGSGAGSSSISSEARDSRPAPSDHIALQPGIFYAVTAHSSKVWFTHGPGLLLAMTCDRNHSGVSLDVRGTYQIPQSYQESRIGLKFKALSLRFDGTYLIESGDRQGRWWGIRLGLGPDITWLSPRPGSDTREFSPASKRTSKTLVGALGLLGGMKLAHGLDAFAGLEMEIDPIAVHYDLDLGDSRHAVIRRLRARPSLTLGLRLR